MVQKASASDKPLLFIKKKRGDMTHLKEKPNQTMTYKTQNKQENKK